MSKKEKPPPIPAELAGEEVNKYGVPLSFWATLNSAQKNYYYNKLSRRGYAKRAWATISQKERERRYAKKREWRRNHRKEETERSQEYRRNNREKTNATVRRYYHAHHAKMVEKHKKRWAKQRSKKQISLSPDSVFRLIDSAISRALPKFVRDDIISAMCLAVLDGQLFVENIGKEAKKFVSAYNREYDHFKTVSLDAPLAGYDGLTLLDRLADPHLAGE